jgi:hypothetical protein
MSTSASRSGAPSLQTCAVTARGAALLEVSDRQAALTAIPAGKRPWCNEDWAEVRGEPAFAIAWHRAT